ncbi:hypothetical protein GCM10010269_45170 [Streptomyces humidus]|uniref:Uncharacterized protein n=1 Tax=Streptomyces humidus TaxID=52259 RepID=A0A918FXP6_9ACTN|nr:hypothetical protein GCM10010269_45170 [Streptomyces humidus]
MSARFRGGAATSGRERPAAGPAPDGAAGPGRHPFTAPVSIPFLKCFWTNGESTATGSRAITITAI